MYIGNEIPKYKKRLNRTIKKSTHKHLYKDCLVLDKSSNCYHKGEYCTVCGKLADFSMIETIKISGRLSRVLSQEELLNMYKDLEIKEVDNIVKDRFITLS